MIPFDVDKALSGEPICTRTKIPAKIAGVNYSAEEENQLAVWVEGKLLPYFIDGHFWLKDSHDLDLFMAEKPKVKLKGWITLYRDKDGSLFCSSRVFVDESHGGAPFGCKVVATVQIEWEEEPNA